MGVPLVEDAVKRSGICSRPSAGYFCPAGTLAVCNDIQAKCTGSSGPEIGSDNQAGCYRLLFLREIRISAAGNLFCVRLPFYNPNEQ